MNSPSTVSYPITHPHPPSHSHSQPHPHPPTHVPPHFRLQSQSPQSQVQAHQTHQTQGHQAQTRQAHQAIETAHSQLQHPPHPPHPPHRRHLHHDVQAHHQAHHLPQLHHHQHVQPPHAPHHGLTQPGLTNPHPHPLDHLDPLDVVDFNALADPFAGNPDSVADNGPSPGRGSGQSSDRDPGPFQQAADLSQLTVAEGRAETLQQPIAISSGPALSQQLGPHQRHQLEQHHHHSQLDPTSPGSSNNHGHSHEQFSMMAPPSAIPLPLPQLGAASSVQERQQPQQLLHSTGDSFEVLPLSVDGGRNASSALGVESRNDAAGPVESSVESLTPASAAAPGKPHGIPSTRIVVDPPNLQEWREKLFGVDEMIILSNEEFETYFPHVDNVYSHRSTQRYKRKPFVSHYWDCRMKGRPPGTPKSDDPNKKKRKRSTRERDLCDVKIKITEYFDGTTLSMLDGVLLPQPSTTAATGGSVGGSVGGTSSPTITTTTPAGSRLGAVATAPPAQSVIASPDLDDGAGIVAQTAATLTGGGHQVQSHETPVFPAGVPGTDGCRFWTIQRVNGNGGNGKGEGVAGPHKHTLEKSDEIKKSSVQRWLAAQEKGTKKSQGSASASTATRATVATTGGGDGGGGSATTSTTANSKRSVTTTAGSGSSHSTRAPVRKPTGAAAATARKHMRDSDMKLYAACFCPFSQRVWIALEAKCLPYQYCEINPFKKPKPTQLLEANPRGLVPAIRKGEWACGESSIILEYLEDLDSRVRLFPTEPRLKANCRLWIDYINNRIVPSFYALLQAIGSEDKQELALNLKRDVVSLMVGADEEGPYFLGPDLCLVDIHFAPFAIRLSRIFTPLHQWRPAPPGSRFQRYIDAIEANPHVQATISAEDLYVETVELITPSSNLTSASASSNTNNNTNGPPLSSSIMARFTPRLGDHPLLGSATPDAAAATGAVS